MTEEKQIIEIHGMPEGAQKILKRAMELPHWFRCLLCKKEWELDDSFGGNKTCPQCGTTFGNVKGVTSKMTRVGNDMVICPHMHGIWENVEGFCKGEVEK